MAPGTFSTRVSGVDPTGENARVVRFVFAVLEDTPLHPASDANFYPTPARARPDFEQNA